MSERDERTRAADEDAVAEPSDSESETAPRGAHLAGQARKGGQAVVEKYGREHMREIGRRGARAVAYRYGLRFYSEIAARNKGVPKRKTGS